MGMFDLSVLDTIIPQCIPVGSPLWAFKHDIAQLAVLEEGDPYTFASQFQQGPQLLTGNMFKDKYWKHYEVLPPDIDLIRIYCDTAQKTKERNDYSVLQCWARSPSKGIFLVDQSRGKWTAPMLESEMVDFWNKHKPTQYKPRGAQLIKVEDKSSGTGLIQSIIQDYIIPIEGIPRHTDKVLRAMAVVKYFAMGYIHLPIGTDWVHGYKKEFREFTPMMTHAFDDQIDPTMDAVEDMLIFEKALYTKGAMS